MAGAWYIHDAGFFSLELPVGWVAQQPNTGTLRIEDPHAEVALALMAIARAPLASSARPRPIAPSEAQSELQKWIESQRHVAVHQAPRPLPEATYPTATSEGLQHLDARHSWLRRLLLRLRGHGAGMLRWRYWAVLNPHLLVLASCHGKPDLLDQRRQTIDQLIASIHLPERPILIGRQFTETVISLARTWFPQTAVSMIDDAHLKFGSQRLSLAGLHRRYLASPEELPTQVRAFLTAVQVAMPASALAGSWRDACERIMPVFLTPRMFQEDEGRVKTHVVHEEWVNGLAIGYSLENQPLEKAGAPDPAQRLIQHEDLIRWQISSDQLHAQAMQNLVRYSHEHLMEGRREEGFTMLCLARADRHNAARILLPELHQKLREHLGATFLAAMPARDMLIAFNHADEQFLEHIRENLRHDFQHARHPVSPKFFLVTPDGIAGDPDDVEEL